MSTYPPDGYEVGGGDTTWANDFAIIDGTGTISAAADQGGGLVRFTTSTHGFTVGQYVRVLGTTSYDSYYVVQASPDSTHFDVLATYVASETGTWYSNKSGADMVRFNNTTPSSHPYYAVTPKIPVTEGMPYSMYVSLQADSIAAGNNVVVGVGWFDGDDTYVSVSNVFGAAVLPSVVDWHRIGGVMTAPVGARKAHPYVFKTATAFRLWIDDFAFAEMPIAFKAYLDNDTSYTSGSTIVYDVELYDYGNGYDTSTGIFTASMAGMYAFNSCYVVQSLDAGESAGPVLVCTGLNEWGTRVFAHTNGDYIITSHSWFVWMDIGDTAYILTIHEHASSRTHSGESGGYTSSTFSAFLVR